MLRIGTMKQLLTTSKIHQSPLLVNLKNTGCIREIQSGFRNPKGLPNRPGFPANQNIKSCK